MRTKRTQRQKDLEPRRGETGRRRGDDREGRRGDRSLDLEKDGTLRVPVRDLPSPRGTWRIVRRT